MGTFVRVFMPIGSPEKTLKLSKKVVERDTALGPSSPLVGFVDIASFEVKRQNAEALQKSAGDRRQEAQSYYNQCRALCGLAKSQTRRTQGKVLWFVVKVRDVLLLKYRGTEEQMELFGFNVVISQTGARKNVRVTIPDNKPEDLLKLADEIIEEDTNQGGSSPLVGTIDMATFSSVVSSANTLLSQWETADEQAQSQHNQALAVLGYAAGQTVNTEGTMYYDLAAIRNRLLSVYEVEEEKMSEWGFKVVISEARTGVAKGTVRVKKGKVEAEAVKEIDLQQANVLPESQFKLGNRGETSLQYYFAEAPDSPPNEFAVTVNPGQELLRMADELGLNIDRVYFCVHNPADMLGQYVLTLMR